MLSLLKSVYCKAIKVTMEFNFHIFPLLFFSPAASTLMALFEIASTAELLLFAKLHFPPFLFPFQITQLSENNGLKCLIRRGA